MGRSCSGFAFEERRRRWCIWRRSWREGVADGRTAAGVAADEGGVGAVEGGDDARLLLRREHGAGEDGGGGVGDGVMDVENIEAMIAADFGHFDGERQGVIGVFEEAVVVDADGVEVDAGGVFGEADDGRS